jgi:hypothetical protein
MRSSLSSMILGSVVLSGLLVVACGASKTNKNAEVQALESWDDIEAQLGPDAIDNCSEAAGFANPEADLNKIAAACTCMVETLLKRVDQDTVTSLWNQERFAELDRYLSQQERDLTSDRQAIQACTAP